MKTETRKVYQCDFCRRRMLSAGAMARHERFCNQNPNNWHRCFKHCEHLEKTNENITVYDETYDENMPVQITHFTCLKTGQKMFSYKFEKNTNTMPDYFIGLVRMPLECEHYSWKWNNDN